MENLTHGLYAILGIAGIVGAFKTIDWLIGLKYMTKDHCSTCRAEVAKTQSAENEKLARIETKVDMLLEMRKNEA